ncbi:35772_t:CDS:2 [Gigaspora margarita]|uniref:35772_t:CDS:1 n=1 Tax=Gigaspora margarita TaxID=4874 RepID=A0ABN7UIC8_GIGMA|nr:35772_t:CDS:2 [Gigaspora margarita]
MDKFDLKLNNSTIFKQISIGITALSPKMGNKVDRLKQFLTTELESNAEHNIIRGPIFERLTPMPYASHITKAASKLAEKLKPYIAIHWPQSSTFDNIDIKHHTAKKILASSFNVNTWVSTRMLNYLQSYPVKRDPLQEELGGSGIQGIFDKLVLTNVDYFIAGPQKCTFTYNIMEARQELFKNYGTIQNTIYRWKCNLKICKL